MSFITAGQILSLHLIGDSVSVDFVIMIMLGSKKNTNYFFFSRKSLILTLQNKSETKVPLWGEESIPGTETGIE